jgi:hypothetical protein
MKTQGIVGYRYDYTSIASFLLSCPAAFDMIHRNADDYSAFVV